MKYSLHLSEIKGTGRDGRIMKEDVQRYLASQVCKEDKAAKTVTE